MSALPNSAALHDWRRDGEMFDFRGLPIFYRQQGEPEAPALLLLHGFPSASWDWHELWPDLAARFHLIAPDFLGLGFSAKPRAHAYSVMEQADMVQALCLQRGISHTHVLAHDYGVSVAQELLARSDAHVDGAVKFHSMSFLNGGLFPESHRARLLQKLLLTPLGPLIVRLNTRAQFGRVFRALFGAATQPTEATLDDFWYLIDHDGGRRVLHRLQRYIPERLVHRARWVGALQTTAVPLKLINGSADPVSGAHLVARYRELVPQQDITELAGIGHYPSIEAPAAVLAAFIDFITTLTTEAHEPSR
jgi:pimeloyl-ACP methyl ester carboxylesterase